MKTTLIDVGYSGVEKVFTIVDKHFKKVSLIHIVESEMSTTKLLRICLPKTKVVERELH